MRKPSIGETIYSLNVGNAARDKDQKLTPVTVTKVGRKYFTTTNGYWETKYHIDDWCEKTEYTSDSCLYESEQSFLDEKEKRSLGSSISKMFGSFGGASISILSLEDHREINRIINAAFDRTKQ